MRNKCKECQSCLHPRTVDNKVFWYCDFCLVLYEPTLNGWVLVVDPEIIRQANAEGIEVRENEYQQSFKKGSKEE